MMSSYLHRVSSVVFPTIHSVAGLTHDNMVTALFGTVLTRLILKPL